MISLVSIRNKGQRGKGTWQGEILGEVQCLTITTERVGVVKKETILLVAD